MKSKPTPLEIELLWLVNRMLGIRHPNNKWSKKETERSLLAWDELARWAITKLEKHK